MTELTGWANFYVIVGTAAGALIGLQFVVMTLIATMPVGRVDALAGDAFSTPTVVHFAIVLLLTAAGCAPWSAAEYVALLWGLVGVGGVVYVVVVARRMRTQAAYHPVFEDRLFHVLLPFAAYALLLAAAGVAVFSPRPALFVVGAAALLLLFVGIHNAWDTVTNNVIVRRKEHLDDNKQP
jgi:hypothetical protein